MDEIKKLLMNINEKDIENKKYEDERSQLKDVKEREIHVEQIIKILKRHLDEKKSMVKGYEKIY